MSMFLMSALFPIYHEKVETPLLKNHLTMALFGKILCSSGVKKDLEAFGDYLLKFSQRSQEKFGKSLLPLTESAASLG